MKKILFITAFLFCFSAAMAQKTPIDTTLMVPNPDLGFDYKDLYTPSVYGIVDGVKYTIEKLGYVLIKPSTNKFENVKQSYKSGERLNYLTDPPFLTENAINDAIHYGIKQDIYNAIWNNPEIITGQFYTYMDGSFINLELKIDTSTGKITDYVFMILEEYFRKEIFPVSLFHDIIKELNKYTYSITPQGKKSKMVTFRCLLNKTKR